MKSQIKYFLTLTSCLTILSVPAALADELSSQDQASIPSMVSTTAGEKEESRQQDLPTEKSEANEATEGTTQPSLENPEFQKEMDQYQENVKEFKHLTIDQVREVFTEDQQEHLLYFGRPTCVHCRAFAPTLKEFNQLIDQKLEYVDIDGKDLDEAAYHFIFKEIGLPGTPALLRMNNGKPLAAWLGGGVTAKELYQKMYPETVKEEAKEDPEIKSEQEIPNRAEDQVVAERDLQATFTQVKMDGVKEEPEQTSQLTEQPKSDVTEQTKSETATKDQLPKTGEKVVATGLLCALGLLGLALGMILIMK